MMLTARVVDSGMTQSSFKELEILIDQCMIANHFCLRRDIHKKNQRSRVGASIQKPC
jgi:P2-related tail formation protein